MRRQAVQRRMRTCTWRSALPTALPVALGGLQSVAEHSRTDTLSTEYSLPREGSHYSCAAADIDGTLDLDEIRNDFAALCNGGTHLAYEVGAPHAACDMRHAN